MKKLIIVLLLCLTSCTSTPSGKRVAPPSITVTWDNATVDSWELQAVTVTCGGEGPVRVYETEVNRVRVLPGGAHVIGFRCRAVVGERKSEWTDTVYYIQGGH